MERATVEVYERRAREWADARPARHVERAHELARAALPGLPRVDLGCGHGPYLEALGEPAVGIDAARGLLQLAREQVPAAPLVRGALEALPFRRASFGAAWARNSYLHVREPDLPLALARLHDALAVGAPLAMSLLGTSQAPINDDFPGRFFARWEEGPLGDIVAGAGFELDELTIGDQTTWVRARRARTLPDFVAADMRVLVCGLNPSVVAADAGYGYAGATNRFWAAAKAVGMVGHVRQPVAALLHDGVGMTDLVKRATPNAAQLAAGEYAAGAARVRRLVAWLRPSLVLFVGLAGWRAAIDRAATPGLQPETFGGSPAYVMPSTSGLNARTSLTDLTGHIQAALALIDR